MTTIHLIYSSLERVFDTHKTDTIVLIQHNSKIKNILTEYCLLPSVVDNIILKYTDSIINFDAYITNTYISINGTWNINLRLITDDYKITVRIENINNNIMFNADLCLSDKKIAYNYHYNQLSLCIEYFNVFMEKMYNKKKYIDCVFDDIKSKHFMDKNSIMCVNEETPYLTGIIVRNYSKFTYLIVTLKCIINGIQKYFKTHDITKYCQTK